MSISKEERRLKVVDRFARRQRRIVKDMAKGVCSPPHISEYVDDVSALLALLDERDAEIERLNEDNGKLRAEINRVLRGQP